MQSLHVRTCLERASKERLYGRGSTVKAQQEIGRLVALIERAVMAAQRRPARDS